MDFPFRSPQIAVTLLVRKIYYSQEWEALQALTVRSNEHLCSLLLSLSLEVSSVQVLEACMKNCGRRFHNEVGRYRFLNELVKLVSPKVS